MALFIHGIGSVDPAPALGHAPEPAEARAGNRLHAIEPNYLDFIDARASRRMSRIVKMGIAAAVQAVRGSGGGPVDGVVAGTGWGCLEDTVAFLQKLVVNGEDMLSPTSFIYSTHNTIAAQVAYHLKCRGYNNTFSHRNISFESALIDAQLLAHEQPAQRLLVGGIDELTDTSFTVLSRLKTFKSQQPGGPLDELYDQGTPGTWAGEGATFFLVSGEAGPTARAQLLAVRTVSFGTPEKAAAVARQLLTANQLTWVDLLITGENGDQENDAAIQRFATDFGHSGPVHKFKHLCGEYPTASAFALRLGAELLAGTESTPRPADIPRTILIYNRFQQQHQSLMLLQAC
ncbi:beta-ketoacyl synthase chain length factor [Hymenobacter sp. DH14]|uniref:Beta-ketoacyl synthase chain length factor n=1 Tax=Hymenobacter cyanobacteriorum TaxID=2926463 RepID=A0A9X2AGJ5_9BACT|nr:beta-ketoacyl synthase chain length factor [Hymenobacter cyanobacteriorum]MCI1186385.1 beta-ketoacyl synthase chain length factor [Hymenobacter cyanobacteriorum]